jgi:glycerol-3-phosphate dehydrogenase (NAD(P)+)
VLWGRSAKQIHTLQANRENAQYLPNVPLPQNLRLSADAYDLRGADAVLLAVPMQALSGFLQANAGIFGTKALVACCKGIDLSSLHGPSDVLRAQHKAGVGVLTGPSFAADIARGLPTALCLAYSGPDAGAVQELLSTPTLRLYLTDDIIGAELGGALKNVIAIAAGVVIGAGLGASARAALMTRGFVEMQRAALALGGRAETLNGLSGFGDLVLTATSEQSRNYRFGAALGAGLPFDGGITVEGAATAKAMAALANQRGLDMPITQMIAALIDGRITLENAVAALMSRPLKKE